MSKVAVLTAGGEDWAAQRMAGVGALSALPGRFVGWGTGAGVAAKGDTALFTEASELRVSGTVSVQGSGSAAAYQCESTLTADSAKRITNAGMFSVSTSGTLIAHVSWDGTDLNQGDQITFTFTIDPS